MATIERHRELRRRRHRRKKLANLKRRLDKASAAERAAIAEKVRKLSPGGEEIIKTWGLEDE